MEKVVVTGGAGFIGSHLAEELARRGFHVTILDDISTGGVAKDGITLSLVLATANLFDLPPRF